MGRGKTVSALDGSRWRVRRRWMDRPLPNVRRRFRANRNEAVEDGTVDGLMISDVADSPGALAIGAGILLLVFILLPLFGVALELIALILVLCSGLAGRILFGRPWIVEAINLDDRARSVAFEVKGWRRSSEAIAELEREINAAGPPEQIPLGTPVYPPSRRA